MDPKEILTKISEMLEKVGVKEALKKPEVIETIYNVMSQHGMKVDKNIFNIVVMTFANTPTDKLGSLFGAISGVAGAAAGAAGTAASSGGAAGANPLAAILGGMAAGAAQPQQQTSNPNAAAANPMAALGALGALAGALGGTAQQTPPQTQSQAQTPNPADAINAIAGIAKMLQQK